MNTPFTIQRGETLTFVVEALTGDPTAVSGVLAKMKSVQAGRQTLMPGSDVPVAATLTTTALPATTGFKGGWSLSLSASQTSTLSAGLYLVDASFILAGVTIIDGPILLEVKNSAVAS